MRYFILFYIIDYVFMNIIARLNPTYTYQFTKGHILGIYFLRQPDNLIINIRSTTGLFVRKLELSQSVGTHLAINILYDQFNPALR